MPNFLESGSEWLASQLGNHAATRVTFSRGGDSVAVDATKGKTEIEVDDGQSLVRSAVVDWIVRPESLRLAGGVVEPRIGDEFSELRGRTVLVHRVLALPGGEVWRRTTYGTLIRVHTKLVEERET